MVIPYVEGLLESVERVKNDVSVCMRPHAESSKDEVEKENICGVVYEILCHSCESKYIGGQNIQHNAD